MRKQNSIFENIDWVLVVFYVVLVLLGWVNIYAAVYNEEHKNMFDLTQNYGRQMLWIGTSLVIGLAILVIDGKFYAAFSFPIYIVTMGILLVVLVIARDVQGARSWIEIGSFKLQPSEFAKFATNMAIAKYLSALGIRMEDMKTKITAGLLILLPMALVLLQNDTGSALVFIAFIFVLYREGLSQNVLIFGFLAGVLFVLALMVPNTVLIGVIGGLGLVAYLLMRKTRNNLIVILIITALCSGIVFSVDYAFNEILQTHQRERIEVLLGKRSDPKGAGYNVNQSLIAIGSGGLTGKGFLQGTQTKYDFVPEQSTDFIFCTVGEEWGFVGTAFVLILFTLLLYRIVFIAERQRSTYTRIYAYGVASILFFHLMINVGMAIGLAPVIGIPLPFFSYGGSSLWGFTVLLFVLIKLDSYRMYILR
ncbi:MAG: rod shape-determining protein RodA [Bacteroidia bacterium]|jgi:rod shape determining protein RodA|nr:rod shape-determining protein RodA [Bacteroidia bacterium]MBP7245123.1 rod shape-determining protein RodA [Bacteroidia bacterium]